jgi:hypothetical protein
MKLMNKRKKDLVAIIDNLNIVNKTLQEQATKLKDDLGFEMSRRASLLKDLKRLRDMISIKDSEIDIMESHIYELEDDLKVYFETLRIITKKD